MISKKEAAENERKYLRTEDLIWYYQDRANNARIPVKSLAYEFVWRLLKKREIFEVVDILTRAQLETTFRGYSITDEEKKQIDAIYRTALKKIEEEKLA